MIIKEIVGVNSDGASWLELIIDGKLVVSAHPLYECPEDATLERDLSYAYEFAELMQHAYESGRNGEEFEIIYVDESENDG